MNPSYKGFELIEFDMCHMDTLYECRNISDFDNFWFFPKSHVSGTELVDELKTLIQDEVVYDLFLIVKNGNKLGFLLSYNYVDSSNMISLSIYLKSEYRNGFNLLYPFLLIFDYYQVKLKIQKFKLSVYNANKFVVNFLNRFSFFELVSRDRVYSEFILSSSELPYIFERCKFDRNKNGIHESPKFKVFILTYCRNIELLYGAILFFKTIRVGFPSAEINVMDNNSIPEAKSEIRNKCNEHGFNFTSLTKSIHHADFIEFVIRENSGAVVIADPDIIYWENMKLVNFNGLIAGRFIPQFYDHFSGCITRPRIHTSLMIIPNCEKLKLELNQIKMDKFEVDFYRPYMYFFENNWYRLDTCSNLFLSLKNKVYSFSENELNLYDHIFCGSHLDIVDKYLGQYSTRMREVHELAKYNHEKLRGIYKEQDVFFMSSS